MFLIISEIYLFLFRTHVINLSDLKPNGQPQRYDGDWCWTQYARYLTPRSEVQNVIDAKLHPAKETSISVTFSPFTEIPPCCTARLASEREAASPA